MHAPGVAGLRPEQVLQMARTLKSLFYHMYPDRLDTLDTFESLGGNADGTGCVDANLLWHLCKAHSLRLDLGHFWMQPSAEIAEEFIETVDPQPERSGLLQDPYPGHPLVPPQVAVSFEEFRALFDTAREAADTDSEDRHEPPGDDPEALQESRSSRGDSHARRGSLPGGRLARRRSTDASHAPDASAIQSRLESSMRRLESVYSPAPARRRSRGASLASAATEGEDDPLQDSGLQASPGGGTPGAARGGPMDVGAAPPGTVCALQRPSGEFARPAPADHEDCAVVLPAERTATGAANSPPPPPPPPGDAAPPPKPLPRPASHSPKARGPGQSWMTRPSPGAPVLQSAAGPRLRTEAPGPQRHIPGVRWRPPHPCPSAVDAATVAERHWDAARPPPAAKAKVERRARRRAADRSHPPRTAHAHADPAPPSPPDTHTTAASAADISSITIDDLPQDGQRVVQVVSGRDAARRGGARAADRSHPPRTAHAHADPAPPSPPDTHTTAASAADVSSITIDDLPQDGQRVVQVVSGRDAARRGGARAADRSHPPRTAHAHADPAPPSPPDTHTTAVSAADVSSITIDDLPQDGQRVVQVVSGRRLARWTQSEMLEGDLEADAWCSRVRRRLHPKKRSSGHGRRCRRGLHIEQALSAYIGFEQQQRARAAAEVAAEMAHTLRADGLPGTVSTDVCARRLRVPRAAVGA